MVGWLRGREGDEGLHVTYNIPKIMQLYRVCTSTVTVTHSTVTHQVKTYIRMKGQIHIIRVHTHDNVAY